MAKCAGITRAGGHCKGIAIDSSGLCHAHSPDRAEERKRYASKGGHRAGRGRPVAEISALRGENASIRERLLEGEIAPGVAAVAVQSLNTDARLIVAAVKARETEELARELQELRDILEARKGDRRWG